MASSQRDIELVIRARDEATKAVNAVAEALKILSGVQQDVGNSAQQSDGQLGRLGEAYNKLSREIEGLKALETVVGQIDRASGAMERLESSVASANDRVADAGAKQQELAQAGSRLVAESERVKVALESERAAAAQLERQHLGLQIQIDAAAKGFNRLVGQMNRADNASEKQRQSYREQLQAILPLVEQQAVLERQQASRASAVTGLERQYAGLTAEIGSNARAALNAENASRKAAIAQEAMVENLAKARTVFDELRGAGDAASHMLGGVALNADAVATAMQTAAKTATELRSIMERQGPVQGVSSPVLTGAAEAKEKYLVYRQAQDEMRALAVAMREAGTATVEQSGAFELARARVIETKAAYDALRNSVTEIPNRLGVLAEKEREVAAALRATAEASRASAAMAALDWESHQVEMTFAARARESYVALAAAIRAKMAAEVEAAGASRSAANSSRESLSLFQRLRGEVLGLAAAYVGLQGALGGLRAVIQTAANLQQAQGQLVAAFNGNEGAAKQEMTYVRGEAERLGYELTSLSSEYAKLALAASASNISVGTTRNLFTALAESGRVAGLTTAQFERVLFDFNKMVELGKVDARDFNGVLRQIPFAARSMAEALGLSNDEFRKMQRSPEGIAANEKVMNEFANKLREHFQDRLPAALRTFNAEWGRFQTTLQESEETVAKSGFMDALAAGLERLNAYFRSDEGQQFFQNLGRALGNLTNILVWCLDHFGTLFELFKAFVAIRIGAFFYALIPQIVELGEALMAAASASTALSVALGGIPLLFGAIAFVAMSAAGKVVSGVSDMTQAFDEHNRQLDKVQQAWADAGGKADVFRQKLGDLTQTELVSQQVKLQDARNELVSRPIINHSDREDFAYAPTATINQVQRLTEQLKSGKLSADEYTHSIDNLVQHAGLPQNVGASFIAWGRNIGDANDKLRQNKALMDAARGTMTDADRAVLGLTDSFDKFGGSIPTDKVNEFSKALNNLKKDIPELRAEAERAQAVFQADQDLEQAQQKAGAITDPKAKAAALAQAQALHDRAVSDINGASAVQQAQDGNRAQYLASARRYVGDDEHKDRRGLESLFASSGQSLDPEKVAWCAAFVNAILHQNGAPGTGSLAARDFLTYGSNVTPKDAEPGDIVVLKGAGAHGHVGFFDGYQGDRVRVLGGNQAGGKVSEESFPASAVLGFRRAPTPAEQAQTQSKNDSEIDAFHQSVTDGIAKAVADSAALGMSPRDLFIQRQMDSFDKRIADSQSGKGGREAAPITWGAGEREKLAGTYGQLFDNTHRDEERKKLEQLQNEEALATQNSQRLTAPQMAANRLRTEGVWNLDHAGNPTDELGQQALQVYTSQFQRQLTKQNADSMSGLSGQLTEARKALTDGYKSGDEGEIKSARKDIADLSAQLKAGLPDAIAYFKAIGDQKTVAQLEAIHNQINNLKVDLIDSKQVNSDIAGGLVSTFNAGAKGVAQFALGLRGASNIFREMRNAFLQFASDFLLKIADMIMQTEILKGLNALGIGTSVSNGVNAAAGGGSGGGLGGLGGLLGSILGGGGAGGAVAGGGMELGSISASGLPSALDAFTIAAPVMHTGGIVGRAAAMRSISPAAFAGALRMHDGGIAGVAPDEYPTILQEGEEVLKNSSPRHIGNIAATMASAQSAAPNLKIINAIDAGHMLTEALATQHGERAIVNHFRKNSRTIKKALG